MTNAKAVLAVALVAITAACGRDLAIPLNATDVSMEQVGLELVYENTGFEEPARLVIRDQQAWEDAWAILTEGQVNPPPAPEIDFETRMVVLAAMGGRPHGGYSIALNEAAATESMFYVSVTQTAPGGQCFTTQMIISPAALASVARFDGEVKFIENVRLTNCY